MFLIGSKEGIVKGMYSVFKVFLKFVPPHTLDPPLSLQKSKL